MSGVATEAATRYAVSSQDTASGLAPSSRTSAGSAGQDQRLGERVRHPRREQHGQDAVPAVVGSSCHEK